MDKPVQNKRKIRAAKPEKPRSVVLQFQMGDGDDIARSIRIIGDEIIFANKDGKQIYPKSGVIRNQYDREKAPKVLSSVPLSMDQPLHYSPDYALRPYDTVLAVDSNTRNIKGQEISVAAIVAGQWGDPQTRMRLDIGATQALEFRNTKCHPDLLAWTHVLKGVENNSSFNKGGRLALIVDSHLGDLPAIQSRKKSILDDYYLPEWCTIFYASDAATDGVVNKALRAADKSANELLDQLNRYSILPNHNLGNSEYFEYMHLWSFIGP